MHAKVHKSRVSDIEQSAFVMISVWGCCGAMRKVQFDFVDGTHVTGGVSGSDRCTRPSRDITAF